MHVLYPAPLERREMMVENMHLALRGVPNRLKIKNYREPLVDSVPYLIEPHTLLLGQTFNTRRVDNVFPPAISP